jgi:phenazine biosynthesis protein phzE
VRRTLTYRNERLAPFWLNEQLSSAQSLAGQNVTVLDAEDGFSEMLAHVLRHLGAAAQVVSWRDYQPGEGLLLAGPGPGDPDSTEDRIATLRSAIGGAIAAGQPLLAVCLSHQILARMLGLDLRALARPRQGEQLTDVIFGHTATLGYYNTFTAVAPFEALEEVEVARRAGTDEVIALRGKTFASLQGHPESALSPGGIGLLAALARDLVGRG